jgi:hypothetical protein
VWNPRLIEVSRQPLHLRGFSAALRSFKRNKGQAWHQFEFETERRSCRIRQRALSIQA